MLLSATNLEQPAQSSYHLLEQSACIDAMPYVVPEVTSQRVLLDFKSWLGLVYMAYALQCTDARCHQQSARNDTGGFFWTLPCMKYPTGDQAEEHHHSY